MWAEVRGQCVSRWPPLPLCAGSHLTVAGPGHHPRQHAALVTRLSPHGSHQENDLGQDFFLIQKGTERKAGAGALAHELLVLRLALAPPGGGSLPRAHTLLRPPTWLREFSVSLLSLPHGVQLLAFGGQR